MKAIVIRRTGCDGVDAHIRAGLLANLRTDRSADWTINAEVDVVRSSTPPTTACGAKSTRPPSCAELP